MGMTIELPDWSLNYHVAAFGAYATIFVESVYLILGNFVNASLLSISILTNVSAVLVAGLGGPSSTPFAITRICITSIFLLWSIIAPENETFNGTYAILCSVAHLVYQLQLRHNEHNSEGFLPQHEKRTKIDEAPLESCTHAPSIDFNDAKIFSRNLRIYFGDSLYFEGAMVPVTTLGTVMVYRVFDFDLGFGLVFAFISACLSSAILLSINYARMRGRRMETRKELQRLLGLIIVTGAFCFLFFTIVEFPDIKFSWWKITLGVAWFIFLLRTSYIACRVLIHATLFSCAACSQREAGIHGPLTQEAAARCVWDDYIMLPAINQDEDDTSEGSTTFRIRRQKGPDLVERFWLNGLEWFQVSPRSFVVFFVSCITVACLSGGALNTDGIFADIGGHVSKNAAFYVIMAFTFVSTGHSPAGDSPELMFVPLRHNFPKRKATAKALVATMLVHAYLVYTASIEGFSSSVIPLVCTITAPLLLAGISYPLNSTGQRESFETGAEGNMTGVDSDELAPPATENWTIDSTLVYSSSRIRCLDLRVLLLGLSITIFDVLCNQYQDEMSITRWPISAVITISVTVVWLYLENMVPTSRELEHGLLGLATATLVGIFSHFNFLDAFGLYDDEMEDDNLTHTMPIPEGASHSKPLLIALYYTTLVSVVVFNRRLVHQRAHQALAPTTNGQSPKKDPLLFSFRVKTSKIDFAWQLRDSRVSISLVFMMLAASLGKSWPLDMNTTVASLLFFALIIGFQLRPVCDDLDEKRSLPHIAALALSALMAILTVVLNRHGVLEENMSNSKSVWPAGTWSAMVFYRLFVGIGLWLEGKGWLTRRK